MPRAIYVGSDVVGAQAVTGPVTIVGFSVRENAGTAAAAKAAIRNGTSAAAPALAVVNLAASGSQTAEMPAIDCPSGVFVDRTVGTTEVIIYVL